MGGYTEVRVNNVFSGRPTWYDRTPVNILLGFVSAGQVPVGLTTEFTYTVPTSRKAQMEVLTWNIARETVAAPIGDVQMLLILTVFVSAAVSDLAYLRFLDNTVGTYKSDSKSAGSILLAGDIIQAKYQDASTGGTTNVAEVAKLTEFDA